MNGHGGNDDDDFIAGNTTCEHCRGNCRYSPGQSSATPAHTIAEISVGSLIDAFGTATRDNSGKVTLDATAGRVRLDFTQVQGALDASAAGNITLNLKTIDRQPVSLFNFTGTGSVTGVDTNPTIRRQHRSSRRESVLRRRLGGGHRLRQSIRRGPAGLHGGNGCRCCDGGR